MTMPYYVAPEQVMKDRAEYAQKGIARGRALVAVAYADGILIVAENPSRTLHKVSEIYDRVAFAGVGKYNEFDQLRVAGIRHADTKGYAYSREDVDARSLANLYAQYLGQVFTHEMKPLEVEILVAELDPLGDNHQLYHLAYDGTVVDEEDFTVLGGDSDTIIERLTVSFRRGWPLDEAVRNCVAALAGPDRLLAPSDLEAAVLEKGSERRAFRRLTNEDLAEMMAAPLATDTGATDGTGEDGDSELAGSGRAEPAEGAADAGSEPEHGQPQAGEPEPPAVPGVDGE